MAGWGGIVSGTAPSLMYKGYQDAQTQELGQQRAGLVNQGLQSEIDQQKANEPLVNAERELKMEGLEEQKNYNAFMRDFVPVAKRAVATQNPQVVADMLSYDGYVPDGRKYKGGIKVDQRTGAKAFTLTDDAGNTQEFGSINEMLEIPLALANPKNFQGWIAESRKQKAETDKWMRDRAWDVRKMGMERVNELEKLDVGHGYKLDEATLEGRIKVEQERLIPSKEYKMASEFAQELQVDRFTAYQVMKAAERGDGAAYERSILMAKSEIFKNAFDTGKGLEDAQKKVDKLMESANNFRKNYRGGGGAGSGGGAGGTGGADEEVPSDPESIYNHLKKTRPLDSEAELRKAADFISKNPPPVVAGGAGGKAGVAGAGAAGGASPSKGGGLSPSGRTMQQLDEMELPSTGDASQSQQAPFVPFKAPSVPGKGTDQTTPVTPTNQQEASIGSRILSAISPNEAYAAETAPGTTGGSTGKRGLSTRPTTAPPLARQGAGGARGLMMADYAPEAWAGMPLKERVKYVMEREGEAERQQKEDAFYSLPVGERARIVMSGAPAGSTKAYGDTFQRRGIPEQGRQGLSAGTEIGAVGTGPVAQQTQQAQQPSLPMLSGKANQFLLQGNGEAATGGGEGSGVAEAGGGQTGLSGNTFQRQPMPSPVQSNTVRQPMPSPVQSNTIRQPMPSPVQSNTIRQPMPSPVQSNTIRQPMPSQTPPSSQQPNQRPITDKWGDQVVPGRGTPVLWHELPTRDRAEDVQQVVRGERSMGKRKDDAIFQAYALAGEDPALAAEVLALGMKVGKIPPIFMWESDNTALPEYQRGGGNISGGLAGSMTD